MILKQFQKVFDIDNRIAQMHSELFELYKQRAEIVNPSGKSPTAKQTWRQKLGPSESQRGVSAKIWALKSHEELVQKWQFYGIKLPEYKKLEAKLGAAHELLATITGLMPELQNKMELVALPPAKYCSFPVKPELRQLQHPQLLSDLITAGLPKVSKPKSWRLMFVYNQPAGIYLDSPQKLFDEKLFSQHGYDLNALGLVEYAAFSLQHRAIIDQTTNTVLLKDYKGGELAPFASFRGSRYFFEMSVMNSNIGNDRFRPAIEVTL